MAGSLLQKPAADGRLAVAVTAEWVSLYDVQTGREVGTVRFPSKTSTVHAFFGPTGDLFINCSPLGCFRWPVRRDPRKPGDVVIGPPKRLRIHPSHAVGTSRDGTVIAEAMYNGYATAPYAGGWILHADRPDPPRRMSSALGMRGVSVSPDGRWVAFGGDRSFVFDSRTGQPVRDWESPLGLDDCRFSPDGKWLATGVNGGRLYAVGTWKPGPQLGHGAIRGFSEDGSTALLCANEGYLRLVEVGTGHELARFEGPESYKQYAAMTADGTKLLEPEKDGLRVWDLRSSARSWPSSGWTGPRRRSRPR